MEMKQYLIDTFRFNDHANRKLLTRMKELPEKEECVRLFGHLIHSQDKWLARIVQYPKDPNLSWWDPLYALDTLEAQWDKSLQAWMEFLKGKSESELFEPANFRGFDGGQWSAPPKDIALQLNYHSIHHRAQMQLLIRKQGIEPDFVDYIGTVYKKVN